MIPYESWYRPHTTPITPADKAAGRIAYAGLALIAGLLALCLLSCSSSKQAGQPDARHNATIQSPPVALDSATIVVQPPRTLLQKLTGKPAAPAYRLPAATPVRIGKKSQVTIQYGNGNTSTQSSTAKKAQSATGDGAKVAVAGKNSTQATDSAVAVASEGGAVAAGPGASASGGATVTKPGFWATLAKPLGYFACAVGVVGVGYLLYLIWGFLPRRKPENQA